MNKLLWIVVAAGLAYGFWHWRSDAAPAARQIEPLLREYLVSGDSGSCSGTRSLEKLENVSVGEFVKPFDGWPVYANHIESCQEQSGITTVNRTYDGSHDSERQVAAAYVRRTPAGGFELYTPQLFKDGQQEFADKMQQAIGNAATQ